MGPLDPVSIRTRGPDTWFLLSSRQPDPESEADLSDDLTASSETGAPRENTPNHVAIENGTEMRDEPREGLPRGYRMRADKHYVDQLAAPSAGLPVRMLPIAQIDDDESPQRT